MYIHISTKTPKGYHMTKTLIETVEQLEQYIEHDLEYRASDDWLGEYHHCVVDYYALNPEPLHKLIANHMALLEPQTGYFKRLNVTVDDIGDHIIEYGLFEFEMGHIFSRNDSAIWSAAEQEVETSIEKSELSEEMNALLDSKDQREFSVHDGGHCWYLYSCTDRVALATVSEETILDAIKCACEESREVEIPDTFRAGTGCDGLYRVTINELGYSDSYGLTITDIQETWEIYAPHGLSTDAYGFYESEHYPETVLPWSRQCWIEQINSEIEQLLEAFEGQREEVA